MRLFEALKVSRRLINATSSHIVLLLISISIALLSYSVRNSDAIILVPVLAAIAGTTVIEYGKQTYKQLFHLMILSGALPKHLNSVKIAVSLIVALALSLSTIPSGRVVSAVLTFISSLSLVLALLSYYVKKVKEGV